MKSQTSSGTLLNTTDNFAITILSLAAFVIVTTEFVIIGLMPLMAGDLGISIPVAGQLVTAFAVTVVFAGPPLTAYFSRVEKRALFMWILVAFSASNAAVALAPGYWTILAARLIPAALLPVFWGIGSDVAGKIVSADKAGKAISQVYLGVTGALLFGLPLGTLLGDAAGWRGTFWFLAVLSAAMAFLLRAAMPIIPGESNVSVMTQVRMLNNRYFIANLILSLAVFTGMFGAYTYLADMLQSHAGIEGTYIGWWLMGFGTVGLIGNYLAGRYVDRHPDAAGVISCVMLGTGAVASVLLTKSAVFFIFSLVLWGIAHTALFPLGQIRVMKAARGGKALAGTLNISACNSGIALGAILGGWVIDLGGIGAAITGASLLMFLCAAAYPWIRRLDAG
ncbi:MULTISPECIES: MFS transporter [Citrobacter]|uniref:MFS transporter n=1 Tax=Citrobacter TaxID=544 RepID=UPI001A31542E|nr:MFS transporter [Citrobacter amalonaticus]HEJ0145132.1 MFS transporter [Citrobacter freundii]